MPSLSVRHKDQFRCIAPAVCLANASITPCNAPSPSRLFDASRMFIPALRNRRIQGSLSAFSVLYGFALRDMGVHEIAKLMGLLPCSGLPGIVFIAAGASCLHQCPAPGGAWPGFVRAEGPAATGCPNPQPFSARRGAGRRGSDGCR